MQDNEIEELKVMKIVGWYLIYKNVFVLKM